MEKEILLLNLDKIHTTKLGLKRLEKNLKINNKIVDYLKKLIINQDSIVSKKGKNYYVKVDNVLITINSYNYCIITAHISE